MKPNIFGELIATFARRRRVEGARETAPPGQRFLAYETQLRRIDAIPGLWHQTCNLVCLLEEARFLGRTPVLPVLLLSPLHNGGHYARSRFEKYFDFSGLLPEMEPVPQEACEHMDFAAREVLASEVSSDSLADHGAALLVRQFPNWNWHEMAERLPGLAGVGDGTSRRWLNSFAFGRLQASRRVLAIASEVKRDLGDFVAVHVRRGDRTRDAAWDAATRPDAILERLRQWLPRHTRLYILSDERTPGFFSPLEAEFVVATMRDFPVLRALVERERDNYMLFAVEWELMRRAACVVGTEPYKGPVLSPYSLLGSADIAAPAASTFQ